MATLKVRTIRKNLGKKGFRESEGDHTFLVFYHDNKKSALRTKVSHGETEIGDPLIGKMARQLCLTKEQFIAFSECTISEERFVELVKDRL